MKRIIYLGSKPQKADNVAKTGLVWARGEVHEVEDDVQAAKLLEHPHVWADADTDYKLAEIPTAKKPEPKPTVLIAPQGGENVSPYWEPVTIVVPAEVFKSLQAKEFVAVFMKQEDADGYEAYKKTGGKPATIKEMVDRFLAWKLPNEFNPDGGITFDSSKDYHPIGTNLFSAQQANEMIRYMLGMLTKQEMEEIVQPWEMDKRSKAYKEWAAAHPEEAAKKV